jgi:hypothetical protein
LKDGDGYGKISDRNIIIAYIQKFELDKIFEVNILENMNLLA